MVQCVRLRAVPWAGYSVLYTCLLVAVFCHGRLPIAVKTLSSVLALCTTILALLNILAVWGRSPFSSNILLSTVYVGIRNFVECSGVCRGRLFFLCPEKGELVGRLSVYRKTSSSFPTKAVLYASHLSWLKGEVRRVICFGFASQIDRHWSDIGYSAVDIGLRA